MRLTIIGFGNQALAWSQNLQDSGFPIRVALLPGSPSLAKARALKIETVEIGSAAFYEDRAFALLTPDHTHHEFMQKFGQGFHPNSILLYAHGFSVSQNLFASHFSHIEHVLFAPKAIGTELRKQYLLKGKLGAVYSLEFIKGDHSKVRSWLFSLGQALGINLGPYQTSFEHETQADLYSEQGLLCSLIPYAASEMFTHLVSKGIEPELAYFECWHELKLIVNAMVEKGPEGFYDLISPNALIGSEKGYQKLFTSDFKASMQSLLTDIQSGKFDREIDQANVGLLRQTIQKRWSQTPLMKTFHKINQDSHEKT
jgi:ketol-acid reductoisomerase